MINQEKMTLSKDVYQALIEHAKSLAPIESCGYLAGKEQRLLRFFPMINKDNREDHFSFDPKEQFQVVKEARADELDLLAVYHSHPKSPARLSAEDVSLFNDEQMLYLILSLNEAQPVLKGFRIKKPSQTEIRVDEVLLEIDEKGSK